MRSKLALLFDSLDCDFGLSDPQVAVAGLNPHSGENGQLGSEERDWLAPLIADWPGDRLLGPVPPDTLWIEAARAWAGTAHHGACDAYLALYHDQGLIPVKMLAFDQAVNTTIGLSIVRTSPITAPPSISPAAASPSQSMVAAVALAAELANRRAARSLAAPAAL